MRGKVGTSGHGGRRFHPADDAGLHQRIRERHLEQRRAGVVLELSAAPLHHARSVRELHLSGSAPGRGVPPEGEADFSLAHPGSHYVCTAVCVHDLAKTKYKTPSPVSKWGRSFLLMPLHIFGQTKLQSDMD